MAFSLNPHKHAQHRIKKIYKSQMQKMVEESYAKNISYAKAVHQIRKRCKKMRGVLRLIRYDLKHPELYREQNEFFKQTAKLLGASRDQKVLADTYGKLVRKYRLDVQDFGSLEQIIDEFKQDLSAQQYEKLLQQVRQRIEQNFAVVSKLQLQKGGADTVHTGVKKSYKKAKKRSKEAFLRPTQENFHEWRKWVKYHMFHLQMLQKSSGCMLDMRHRELKELGDILGDEHDLSVFESFLHGQNISHQQEMQAIIYKEQTYLRARAKKIAKPLFCAKPKVYAKAILELSEL